MTATATAPARRQLMLPGARRPSRSRVVRSIAKHAVAICAIIVTLYPLQWMVGASFRPDRDVFKGIGLWPAHFTTDDYTKGWAGGTVSFSTYFLNSTLIAVLAVVGNVLGCTLTAYAFARLTFPFKRPLFALLIATMLLPYQVTLVPQYIIFNKIGWVNTILPLIVPRFLAVDAFFVFLMVQFIRTIPRELSDAARVDGCGHWGTFFYIVVPLALPAIGTTAMFTFINTWNDFLGPLLYLNTPDKWTVPQGLASFIDVTGQSSYGQLFAMSVLSLAPLVGFFFAAQRLLIEGVATSGLK